MTTTAISPGIRARMNAWLLHVANRSMDRTYGRRKRALYGGLPQTIVEIGPGAGANVRYYEPRTRMIAVEPNPAMHPYLRSEAGRRHLELTIQASGAEHIDLPDSSTRAVIGTLVLCSVRDPRQVLSEIRRILVPGGRYIFLEHVAARSGTRLRLLQDRLLPPWRWLADGCHLNRNTHRDIRQAGFRSIDMDCFSVHNGWLPFSPHIAGVAVK